MKTKEPLISFEPKTDFEKLLFANDYIKVLKKQVKELQFKIGVLNSDKDELIDTDKVKRAYEAMKFQIERLAYKNKRLKETNDNLFKELIKARNQNKTD